MPEGDCSECLALIQDVTLTARNKFGAIAHHDTAVHAGSNAEQIAAMKQQVDFWSLKHQNAVDRYQVHLRTHQVVMSVVSETRLP